MQIPTKVIRENSTMELLRMYYSGTLRYSRLSKKPCENIQSKIIITKLLLEGQNMRQFLQLKNAVTRKNLVSDAQVPMGFREESFEMIIDKFKATAFSKKYAARYQLSYLRKSQLKSSSIAIQAYSTRLEEINWPFQFFSGPENKPLSTCTSSTYRPGRERKAEARKN